MRKIIQIDEYEYNKLVETANFNERQIDEKALALWRKNGVAEIDINVKTHTDYNDKFSIKCDTFVFYKTEKFFIPEQIRHRFQRIINENIMYAVENKFGGLIELVNIYNKKINILNYWRYILYGIAASGWAVATTILLI